MKSRFFFLFILVFIFVFYIYSEPSAGQKEKPEDEKAQVKEQVIIRVGAPADDYFFNPDRPGRVTLGMGYVNANIFDTLTRMDTDFNIEPMLARSWEYIEEEGVWRFYLRRGVMFHDGQRFTAGAVKETMNRIALDYLGDILKIDQNSTSIAETTIYRS